MNSSEVQNKLEQFWHERALKLDEIRKIVAERENLELEDLPLDDRVDELFDEFCTRFDGSEKGIEVKDQLRADPLEHSLFDLYELEEQIIELESIQK